jgi:hypothetical protein
VRFLIEISFSQIRHPRYSLASSIPPDTDGVMECVEKGTRDKKVLGLIKSALMGRVSRRVVEGEVLKKDK